MRGETKKKEKQKQDIDMGGIASLRLRPYLNA